jgi:hypothetical protein
MHSQNARFGEAQLAHLSARARVASRLVRPPCAPRCSARRRTIRVYGSPVRERARPQSRAATPPSLMPHRRTRSQLPRLQRRHRFDERQLKLVARIRAPSTRASATAPALACSSAVSQACVSLVVRGVGRRSTERHRRRRTSGCCCRSSGSLPNAIRRTPPTASASGTHNRSQCSRWCWCWCADAHEKGRARRSTTRCHSASWRTQAHWQTTATRIAAHVRAVPFELLSSFSTTIEDVSQSQI